MCARLVSGLVVAERSSARVWVGVAPGVDSMVKHDKHDGMKGEKKNKKNKKK